ncbi:MAG: hypothetical protein KGZ39_05675 [Simkania sp.]|nr:hypothetical protein [Simkania sp.]
MNPLSDLTASPVLYKLGDKTWELSPLTKSDLGDLLRFAQFHSYYTLKKLGDIPADLLRAELKECSAKRVSLEDQSFQDGIATLEGIVEVVFLSLRHRHKDVTREQVDAFSFVDLGKMNEVIILLSSIYNGDDDDVKKNQLQVLRDSYCQTATN